MLFKYRLTTLFSLIVLVAVLLLVYLRLWPASPLLAAVTTIAIVSVVSIYLDFKRNGTGACGAFTGGLLGGCDLSCCFIILTVIVLGGRHSIDSRLDRYQWFLFKHYHLGCRGDCLMGQPRGYAGAAHPKTGRRS